MGYIIWWILFCILIFRQKTKLCIRDTFLLFIQYDNKIISATIDEVIAMMSLILARIDRELWLSNDIYKLTYYRPRKSLN